MILQKIKCFYFLIFFIIISCNNAVEKVDEKKNVQPPKVPQNDDLNIKVDTAFNYDIRPGRPLYLNEIYTDTFQFIEESEKLDYFALVFQKLNSTFYLLYHDADTYTENYFSRGEMVEVKWRIDKVYIAAEDDSLAFDTWLVEANKISNTANNDTLSVLEKELKLEFPDYHILDWVGGDLNQDEKEDFIVVLESDFTDSEITGEEETRIRKAVLLENIDFPKIRISAVNDNVVDCSMCSGMGNRDPFKKVVIKNNYFSFESFYSGQQSDYFVITFKYEEDKKDWFLHKIGMESTNREEEGKEVTQRTIKNFGRIKFKDYEDIKDQ